jgi:hypothetical protein
MSTSTFNHQTGSMRPDLDVGGPLERLLDDADELAELDRAAVAQVEDLVAQGPIQRPHHAVHNIIDVGVVARRGAVPVLLDCRPPAHVVDELVRRHVGPPPRAIHREKPKARHVQTVQAARSSRGGGEG